MIERIATHDHDALCKYFRENVSRPWGIVTAEIPETGVTAGPVSVGNLKSVARWLFTGARFKVAMWAWLRPDVPRLNLDGSRNCARNASSKNST
jgi:hypothetical protein